LTIAPHARLRRRGLDLQIHVPISFAVAALGGTISVETFDGPLEVQIPAGTQNGRTIPLRGRGMPAVRGNARGNLHVTTHVVVPTKLSRRQRELLEEFADIGGDQVDERSFLERFKDAFKVD
jgi:molecular chaperone DnaJ